MRGAGRSMGAPPVHQKGRALAQASEQEAAIWRRVQGLEQRGFSLGAQTAQNPTVTYNQPGFHASWLDPGPGAFECHALYAEVGPSAGTAVIEMGLYTVQEVTDAGFTARLFESASVSATGAIAFYMMEMAKKKIIDRRQEGYILALASPSSFYRRITSTTIKAWGAASWFNSTVTSLPRVFSHKAGENVIASSALSIYAMALSQTGKRILS